MTEKIQTQNTFQSTDAELRKQTVTAKVEKLVNAQIKKAG